jgi:hypothetical protein
LSVKRKATNSCTQNRKSKSSRTPLKRPFPAETNPLDFDPYAPNPEEVLLQDDGNTLVRKAMEKPPPNFREVLILRELEGLVRSTGPASNVRYHELTGNCAQESDGRNGKFQLRHKILAGRKAHLGRTHDIE